MVQSYSRKWGTIYQELRDKMSLLCLQILLMLFFNHHETWALANSFGKYFVVAVPRLHQQRSTDIPSIHFYLSTVFSAKDVEVFITTPHYGDSTLKHYLVIPKDGFREYSLDRKYFSNQEIGKKWTYLLAGKEYFGLYVMLIENEKSVATFQALPIEEWGTKYYAFTLRFNPSIQIISSENDNFVSVSLKVANPERFSLIYKGHDYSNAEKDFEFYLKRWEAFTISNCNDAQAYMTGSTISGLKTIGVISGNCPGRTNSRFCNLPSSHTLGESATDIVAEMLRPETGSGTEFIFVGIPARSSSPSAMIVSTAKNTLVDIVTSADGRTVSWIFLKPGEWKEFEADFIKGNCVIKSDQNVHVLIVQSSPCSNINGNMVEPLGDAAISLLIPNSQFFMRYHWNTAGTSKKTYIVIVAEWPDTTDLLLDDKTLSSDVEWAQVFGSTKFRVANIEVSQNSHSLVSKKFKYFGLYLYGLSEQMAYMHPVGFNGCKFNSTLTKINFNKDCDYPSDKEMYRIIESGLTDTRVERMKRQPARGNTTTVSSVVNGQWSDWTFWTCKKSCAIQILSRQRHCDNPAPDENGKECWGDDEEYQNQPCDTELECPIEPYPPDLERPPPDAKNCPAYKWGENCAYSCSNCAIDCEEKTGECEFCKNGFKDPFDACKVECGEGTYGQNCMGACQNRCKADCFERRNGDCELILTGPAGGNMYLVPLILLLVPFGLLLYLGLKRKVVPPQEEEVVTEVQAKSMSSPALQSKSSTLIK